MARGDRAQGGGFGGGREAERAIDEWREARGGTMGVGGSAGRGGGAVVGVAVLWVWAATQWVGAAAQVGGSRSRAERLGIWDLLVGGGVSNGAPFRGAP